MKAPKRILGPRCSPYSFDRLLAKSKKAARRAGKPDINAVVYCAQAASASWEAHARKLAEQKPKRAC